MKQDLDENNQKPKSIQNRAPKTLNTKAEEKNPIRSYIEDIGITQNLDKKQLTKEKQNKKEININMKSQKLNIHMKY